jgi:hypothetical protein
MEFTPPELSQAETELWETLAHISDITTIKQPQFLHQAHQFI